MKKGIVPRSGIDTERCQMGFQSYNRGWIFGYKLHMVSSTGSLIVPLSLTLSISANVTTAANVQRIIRGL